MNDTKVCIVSLIGKTQLLHNQSKAWKLNSLIQKNYFKTSPFEPPPSPVDDDDIEYKDYKKEFGIETYHDFKNRVIYIHLESIYDTNDALELLFKNSKLDTPKTFFELWEQEHIKYLRSILFLFSISHIILISSPSCEFEIGYIRFFRIVETLRVKLLPSIVELIKSLNLPITKEWLYAGRPCSPRVLFAFENCPPELLTPDSNDSKQAKLIEKLQHSLEDQIYNSLRKSYVITNISNNSLFSIPANQEFAYIHRLTAQNTLDTNRFLLSNLFMQCSKSKDSQSFSMRQTPNVNTSNLSYLSNQIINSESIDSKLFRRFVFEHVSTALRDGFNDNIGRTNVIPVFELPTVSCFEKLFDALSDFFLNEPKSTKLKRQYAEIKAYVDTESQFSENRCKKVLPAALNIYQENLPGHYTKVQHQQRLDKAIHFYSLQARGPMYNTYLEQLTQECLNIWTNGRQLCEAISLTEHPCVYNLHKLPNNSSDELDTNEVDSAKENAEADKKRSRSVKSRTATSRLRSYRKRSRQAESVANDSTDSDPESSHSKEDQTTTSSRSSKKTVCKPHNSNIVTMAASNCGEFQSERKDPFDLKEANYSFYEGFSNMTSKKKLFKYEFQLFKPSNENQNVVLQMLSNHTNSNNQDKPTTQVQETQPFSYANLSQEDEVAKVANKRDGDQLFPSPVNDQPVQQQLLSSVEKQSISPLRTTNLASLSSNEVYLPGMTHSDSPPGLLPRFSSWSLVSIGKYSQYSAHSGINQPGFLSNHCHLLPWDIIVSKHLVISSVDKQLMASRKNSKKQANTDSALNNQLASLSLGNNSVSVRAYIGMEYECPCGHRFFCSGPDKLSKLSANGNVKDDAYKLLFENMPLYTACPCRKETPYMAQMMRVFIVTPVSYTINLADLDARNVSPPPRRNKSPSEQRTTVRISIQINPRVQPGPSSPTYFPSCESPVSLSENSIWVLRLPYIYMNDSGQPYYRPKDFETLKSCRILKGMFQAVLVNSDDTNKIN